MNSKKEKKDFKADALDVLDFPSTIPFSRSEHISSTVPSQEIQQKVQDPVEVKVKPVESAEGEKQKRKPGRPRELENESTTRYTMYFTNSNLEYLGKIKRVEKLSLPAIINRIIEGHKIANESALDEVIRQLEQQLNLWKF